jgi:hypothetical protein
MFLEPGRRSTLHATPTFALKQKMPFPPDKRRLFFAFLLSTAAFVFASDAGARIRQPGPLASKVHESVRHSASVPAIGFVDSFSEETADAQKLAVSGWALSELGVASIELVLNGQQRFPLAIAIPRADVAQAHPGYPEAGKAGFEGTVDFSTWPDGMHKLQILVTDRKGGATVIWNKTLPSPNATKTWADLLEKRKPKSDDVYYFIMGTSNLAAGGAAEIDTIFRPYESDTVKVGIRVPILYLRTTKGKAEDYAFDPDFPATRKCGARTIAEDNLHGVIDYAIKHKLPVLFTLNGGIWADAACDVPEWDINDVLEQDVANCQWNEKNQVMPDDYLKNLSGSQASPELGRALTFNVHAAKNRQYKKRNLQQAAKIIRDFSARHPDLFIGVNLDPDLYINPFFEGKQWYDYNPGTLTQFREWLQGSGPYAGQASGREPDLSRYRRKQPLSLAQVKELSGRNFKSWDMVEPPRTFATERRPYWENAWVAEWEHFRRHLVGLHYDELSEWLVEAGIGKEFIYSAQGFMAPGSLISPFPIRIDSPVKNYDTGGMSVEGAIPASGHLGAILYGASAVNQIRMEGRQSLFSVFRKLDPDWAVVEHNTANLQKPQALPGLAEAYQSLRDIHNYGARFISPMAWNGSRGSLAGQAGFVSYTALRDSPLEDAIKHFMATHANLPRRARLWTFGAGTYADADGWQASDRTRGSIGPGRFSLRVGANGRGSLMSPDDLAFRTKDYRAIVVKIDAAESLEALAVDGQTANGKWSPLIPATAVSKLEKVNAGLLLPLPDLQGNVEFKRIRLNWKTKKDSSIVLQRIAFYVR